MKAMLLNQFGEDLVYSDVPEPEPMPGEVRLIVEACGTCGSDLKIVSGKHPNCAQIQLPFIPGHEVCGRIDKLGEGVSGWEIGDRAVVSMYKGCLTCESCRRGSEQLCESPLLQITGFNTDGGYAEKMVTRVRNLVRIPDSLPSEKAAIVTDALGSSYRAAFEIAKVKAQESALVVGCGGLGVHMIQLLKMAGLEVTVCDINPDRLEIAPKFGVDHIIYGSHLEVPEEMKFDVIFDVSGKISDYDSFLKHAKRKARFVMVGYSVDAPSAFMSSLAHINEIQMLGIRGASYLNFKNVMQLVIDGKIEPVVGRTAPLSEANEVLAELKAGTKTPGRLVLIP